MATSRFDKFGPSRAGKIMKNKNGHETVKETSPRPLDTTILHEISPRFSWHQRFCELRTSYTTPCGAWGGLHTVRLAPGGQVHKVSKLGCRPT